MKIIMQMLAIVRSCYRIAEYGIACTYVPAAGIGTVRINEY